MKAFLKNYRQSPRKVRIVGDLIKGKRVAEAFMHLKALPKRASGPITGLLASAVANAKQAGVAVENLMVANVTVNKGIVMKRMMPRARGSGARINKRTSHVELTLKDVSGATPKEAKKEKKVTEKKPKAEPKEKKVKKVVKAKTK